MNKLEEIKKQVMHKRKPQQMELKNLDRKQKDSKIQLMSRKRQQMQQLNKPMSLESNLKKLKEFPLKHKKKQMRRNRKQSMLSLKLTNKKTKLTMQKLIQIEQNKRPKIWHNKPLILQSLVKQMVVCQNNATIDQLLI